MKTAEGAAAVANSLVAAYASKAVLAFENIALDADVKATVAIEAVEGRILMAAAVKRSLKYENADKNFTFFCLLP